MRRHLLSDGRGDNRSGRLATTLAGLFSLLRLLVMLRPKPLTDDLLVELDGVVEAAFDTLGLFGLLRGEFGVIVDVRVEQPRAAQ